MKKLLTATLLGAFLASPLCVAEMHEFTSADGSKKLWAEVQGYDSATGTVTLMLTDKRRIQSPVTAFSEDDKTYIEKAGLALAAGRFLAIRFEDEQEIVSEKKNPTNGYQTIASKDGFKLKIRNNGQTNFEGLTADYQIFYAAYLDPFKDRARTDQVKAGKMDLPLLAPRADASVDTEGVPMTSIKRLPLSECTGGS